MAGGEGLPSSATAAQFIAGELPAGMRLRPLRRQDAAAVARLAGELGAGEPDHWRWRLEPSQHANPIAWGLEVNGRLVAVLCGHVRDGDFGQAGEAGWLEALAVDPAWQGRGLARLLAQAFIENCAHRRVARVITLVDLHDQPLRRFFHALGFRQSPLLCVERRA